MSICVDGVGLRVAFLCRYLFCPFSIVPLRGCAFDNYALASSAGLCRNWAGQHLIE